MTDPLHHPNLKDPEGSTCCFLNSERVCGPDCIAFIPQIEKPTHSDFIGKEWSKCHILINLHRGGKHLVILAEAAGNLVGSLKKQSADAQRTNQPEPKL